MKGWRHGAAPAAGGLWVVVAAGCGAPECVLPICDVRAATCQQRVLGSVGCARGQTVPDVPVSVLSREEYTASLSQVQPSAGAQQRFAELQAALATLDLEPPRVERAEVSQQFAATVGAFYSFDAQRIVMIEDGFPLDSEQSTALLAHEYVHALQDASGALESQRFATTDAFMAASAVVEGDAQWTADRLYVAWAGQDPQSVEWSRLLDRWAGRTGAAYRSQPSRVRLAARYFIYPFGTRYAARRFAEGGQAAIDAELESPPGSSAEVVAQRRSADAALREGLSTVAGPVLEEAELLEVNSLGWWILGQGSRLGFALRRAGVDPSRADPAPVDVVTLWAKRDTRAPLAAVRLRLPDSASANRLAALWNSLEGLRAASQGADVLMLASSDETWLAELGDPARLRWGPQSLEASSEASSAPLIRALACPSPAHLGLP